MNKLLENRKIIFYDFEVLKSSVSPKTGKPYWCVVFIDGETKKKRIIRNDVQELLKFYTLCKDDIFVGYNSRSYDQWIFKGLLLGYCAGKLTTQLIEQGIKGHNLIRNHNKIKLYNYDAINKFNSLKQLEAFMGSTIKETDVPFWIDRPITEEEELDLIRYCVHDVEELMKVFERTYDQFNTQVQLMEMYDMDASYISKTTAQLTAIILEAKKQELPDDEYDFIFPDTLKLDKYKYVEEWFRSVKDNIKNPDFKFEFVTDVAGTEATYASGGVHSSLPNYNAEGLIFSADVALT